MTTCDTCPAPSAGTIAFIRLDHSHSDWNACVACATDALLNSFCNVAFTVYPAEARGVEAAA